MTERDVQNAIRLALGTRPDLRLWRQNAGRFFHVSQPCSSCRARGRHVVGLPAGAADLGGIYKGRVIQVEVKADTGQSAPQKNWQRMIETHGGIYVVARSAADVIAVL